MAERRMFAKTIIDSDAFLDMPISARLLYYDLSMRADDDGFVNSPKKIMRMVGATQDDMSILALRKFIIPFDNGVVVIKHWHIHNYIRKDTYSETPYKEQKELLEFDENKSYRLKSEGATERLLSVDGTLTQDRLGKDSIGKDSLELGKDREDKGSKEKNNKPSAKKKAFVDASEDLFPNDEILNETFKAYAQMREANKFPLTEYARKLELKKLKEYGNNDPDKMIAVLEQSICRSYRGLFPLNNGKTNNNKVNWDNV